MSPSSLSTHECVPSGPMDLWISSLPKCPLTHSSLRKSLPSNIPLPRSAACQCRLMQRWCSLTALCASSVTRVPLPFRSRSTFFIGFSKYISNKRKTFFLSLTSFARLNSRRALASQHQYLGHKHVEKFWHCSHSASAVVWV